MGFRWFSHDYPYPGPQTTLSISDSVDLGAMATKAPKAVGEKLVIPRCSMVLEYLPTFTPKNDPAL